MLLYLASGIAASLEALSIDRIVAAPINLGIQNGADGSGTFYYRVPGDRFLIGHTFEVASAEYHYGFTCPFALPEKSDIDVRVAVRTNNALVTAAYDMILIKNQGGL